MFNFEEYLKMSKHNPRFVHDFKYVLHELSVSASNGTISEEERQRIYYGLCNTFDGEKEEVLNKTFNRFDVLLKEGFYNLIYSEKGLEDLLAARKTCIDFYNWVDIKRHRLDNPFIQAYLNNLGDELIRQAAVVGEEFWDCYDQFKRACRVAVARGLISRALMDRSAKILEHAMMHEHKVKKSILRKDIQYLNLFDTEVEVEEFDLDISIIEIITFYITDLNKFNEASKRIHDQLYELRKEGKIDDNKYARSNALLSSYTSQLHSLVNAKPSDPLVMFNLCERKGNFAPMCLFNAEQVSKAAEYGRMIVRTFTNEFLENELVNRILIEDMSKFPENSVASKQFMQLLRHNLDLLRNFDIITIQQYLQYLEAGKEKFK
jgi:hypothetical protein